MTTSSAGRRQSWSDLRLWINQAGTVLHVEGCSTQPPFPMRRVDWDDTSLIEAATRALAEFPRLRPHACVPTDDAS